MISPIQHIQFLRLRIADQEKYIEEIKASDRSPERKAEIIESANKVLENLNYEYVDVISDALDLNVES